MKTGSWHILRSGPGEPALNMAMDDVLLKSSSSRRGPVLRFYGWTEPAATFGYFQRYTDVERMTSLRPLIRRPTGGGLVSHEADWTYSLAVPPRDPWYALSAVESYQKIHEWIRTAFELLGIRTVLAPECLKTQPGQCFQGHEKFDLLWHGRKIAGAAQRRTRDGLLIQGSIQPASLPATAGDWNDAMCEAAASQFGIAWSDLKVDAALAGEARTLASQQYSLADYNQKR